MLIARMSKKTRRRRVPNLPPEAFRVPAELAGAKANAATSVVAADPPTESMRRISAYQLRIEYRVVLQDLRTTLAIFAGLLLVMVVLSLFIR